jgi:hypothetical protein
MSVKTMQELLIDKLKDLYSAEKQIVGLFARASRGAPQSFGRDEGAGKPARKDWRDCRQKADR